MRASTNALLKHKSPGCAYERRCCTFTLSLPGGSICRCDGTRLRVGPAPADANPGPALPSTAEVMMQAGAVLVMATSGGGGYGKA